MHSEVVSPTLQADLNMVEQRQAKSGIDGDCHTMRISIERSVGDTVSPFISRSFVLGADYERQEQ